MKDNGMFFNNKQQPSIALLKYWNHSEVDSDEKDLFHRHNFWQLDIAEAGHSVMSMGTEEFAVSAGDFVIIPPKTDHYYRYDGKYRNWSFKFEMEGGNRVVAAPCVIEASETGNAVFQMIMAIMLKHSRGMGEFTLPEHINDIVLIEYMLAGIISWTMDRQPQSTISDKVRRLVNERQGMPVKVEDIALELGYSRVHLNVLVKESSGMPVKRLIDEERSRFARRLLKYSDLNSSEIADAMDFPDVFSFSKFFKRMNGRSPSQWKAEQH